MNRLHILLATASVVVAHPLYGQRTANSSLSTFREGQWGVEFIPARDLAEAGVLRFSTPTRGWVLDGSAAFDHQATSGTPLPNTEQSAYSINVGARVGPRWYHSDY